eukprot:1397837-Pleurochrysis_carterae.AAC.1
MHALPIDAEYVERHSRVPESCAFLLGLLDRERDTLEVTDEVERPLVQAASCNREKLGPSEGEPRRAVNRRCVIRFVAAAALGRHRTTREKFRQRGNVPWRRQGTASR